MMSLACAGLFAVSIAAVRRRAESSIGVLLSLLPGTVFLASTMNPSALEICAAIALWSTMPSVFAIERTRLGSLTFGIAGALLILTRAIGPVLYVLIILVSYLAVKERRSLAEVARKLRGVLALHGVAVLFAAWWYLGIYSFQTNNSLAAGVPGISLRSQMNEALHHIPTLLDQAVGNFGWLDAPMPRIAIVAFCALYFLVVARSFATRQVGAIMAMLAISAVTILVVIILDVNYYAMLRAFGAQGRHIVPLLVGVPIIAASLISWNRKWEIVTASAWGIIMVWSGLGALRRYTVGINGDNALDMLRDRAWNPILGFWPTVMLLGISTIAVVCLVPYSRTPAE